MLVAAGATTGVLYVNSPVINFPIPENLLLSLCVHYWRAICSDGQVSCNNTYIS